MRDKLTLLKTTTAKEFLSSAAPLVGRVLDVLNDGHLIVNCNNVQGVKARMVTELAATKAELLIGQDVILIFENNDPKKPIAVASLQPVGDFASAVHSANRERELQNSEEDKHILIQAKEKLELRVGKASIIIDANGKITIRGANLLSRSTGPIRIKGGHVDIN